MVSTLRITSVVAVIVAGLLVVLVVGPKSLVPGLLAKFAVGSDEEVERILQSPSVVDLFWEDQGDGSDAKLPTKPPLVTQAEMFARIIDPPEPAQPPNRGRTQAKGTRLPARPTVQTSSKLTLVGTSFVASDPQSSFAYVRLPDETHRWVRQGDEVGHQAIKEIKHGALIYSDGQRDVELTVEAVPGRASILEGGAPVSAPAASTTEAPPARPTGGRITGRPVPRPWGGSKSAAELDEIKQERLEAVAQRIRESKEAGVGPNDVAEIRKMLSEARQDQSSRVTTEEAEKLEDLGREMNESQKAPPRNSRVNINRKLSVPRAPKK
jgi:hypothetical protein